jgi:hypothetical protein
MLGKRRRIQTVPNHLGGCIIIVDELSTVPEDAEFIVRAVNNHDELVVVIEGLLGALTPKQQEKQWPHLVARATLNKIKEA